MVKYLLIFFIAFSNIIANGQGAIEKKRHISDKVFFGLGLGLQFGTATAIDFSPMGGYKPIDNLYLGLKGKYEYYKDNNYDLTTSIYGGSLFGTYAFFESALVYAEYEVLNLETAYFDPLQVYSTDERYWQHTPLIGVGYLQSVGDRSKIMLLLLWNLNESYNTYYSNPILRVSFLF